MLRATQKDMIETINKIKKSIMESKYYEPEIEDLNIGQEIWITNLDNYAKVHDNLPCKGIITELTGLSHSLGKNWEKF